MPHRNITALHHGNALILEVGESAFNRQRIYDRRVVIADEDKLNELGYFSQDIIARAGLSAFLALSAQQEDLTAGRGSKTFRCVV